MLADFLDMESSEIVTMHIQSVDQNKAIKTIKRTITELDRSKIEEQKKAVRAGYDMDIIPSDIATYGSEAKKLFPYFFQLGILAAFFGGKQVIVWSQFYFFRAAFQVSIPPSSDFCSPQPLCH